MNPGRFYTPYFMGARNFPLMSPMMKMANVSPTNIGVFSKITNSIRSVNWSSLLNGANKTLNVVNQAIPLVRQAGPMVNNMKSMLSIAKAFRSETVKTNSNNRKISNSILNNDNNINGKNNYEKLVQKKEVYEDNYPNFFV